MRRSIALAIVAGVVSLASVVPGSAQSGELGICTLSGTSTFADPIGGGDGVIPSQTEFSFAGGVECGSADRSFAGDLTAEGTGTIGCALHITQGLFRVEISTGDGTREVWAGQFSTAGTVVGAIIGNINQISQETFNEETQEWESDGEPVVPNVTAIAGNLLFSGTPDDVSGCIDAGDDAADFDGTVVFGYGGA